MSILLRLGWFALPWAPLVAQAADRLPNVPLVFEQNLGQYPETIHFVARGAGVTVLLATDGIRVTRSGTSFLRLVASRGGRMARPIGEQRLPIAVNSFHGKRWRTHLPAYGRVWYPDVYPGISLVFHGAEGALEHDWIVAPGADPSRITFELDGAARVALDESGDVLVTAADGTLRLRKPRIYQRAGEKQKEIAGGYVRLGKRRLGFRLGNYEPDKLLVIDPVLTYSTYLGGPGDDALSHMAVDRAGNVYAAAQSTDVSLAATTGTQPTPGGPADLVVANILAGRGRTS